MYIPQRIFSYKLNIKWIQFDQFDDIKKKMGFKKNIQIFNQDTF